MKKWSKRKRWLVSIATSVAIVLLLSLGGFFAIAYFNLFHAHEHCIKNTGLSLRIYAGDHEGNFPFHTNGFGDALAVLVKECSPDFIGIATAPGDNGELLKECVRTGSHMPDDRCTRMYVQGLREAGNREIAMVFDRYPTRGGDHFRKPWGEWLREVCLADGSMQVIKEEDWPAFQTKQIGLLLAEGFTRADAEKIYMPMPKLK